MAGKRNEDSLTVEDKLKAALVPEVEQPYPIPGNWVWTKMRLLMAKSTRTIDPSRYANEMFESYSVPSFPTGDPEIIQGNKVGSSKQIVEPNDVLLCKINPRINRVWLVGEKRDYRQIASTEWIVLRVDDNINPNYIKFALQSPYFRDIFTGNVSGVGGSLTRARPKDAAQYPVPIASLSEQNRISEKLESLLGKIKEAKALLDEVPEILQNFRQTVLAVACSGKLTKDWRKVNPKVESAAKLLKRIQKDRKRKYDEACRMAKEQGTKKPQENYSVSVIRDKAYIPTWAEANLDNSIYIAGRIGWRGLKAEEYTEDGPLFLSVYSLNYGEEVDFRDTFHISMERYEESPEIQLQENDILLAKDGAGIGKIGIVRNLNQLATVNSSLLVIRCQEAFIPKFLFYFLSGPQLQDIVKTRITGSATPHLFQRDIKEFVLSIPPLAEQEEIVARVESLFSKADDLEAQCKEAMDNIESLPEIILSKAFRGELVPQDPNDEPASGLLERITFEKEKHETEKVEGTKKKKHKQNV